MVPIHVRLVQASLLPIACLVVLAPLAAAHDYCTEHQAEAPPPEGTLMSHYLLTDAEGDLTLSNLAPSAMNRTTWSTRLTSTGESESTTLRMSLPLPDYVVNEEGRIRGQVKVSVREVSEDPVQVSNGQPKFGLKLIEGERSVDLVYTWSYYSYAGLYYPYYSYNPYQYYWGYHFDRGFPGHEPEAAHTHGDGSSTERRLHASDLAVEFSFGVEPDATVTALTPVTYEFNVLIEGTSFLQLYALETIEAPAEETSEETDGSGDATESSAEAGESGESSTTEPAVNETSEGEGGETAAAPVKVVPHSPGALDRATPASMGGLAVPLNLSLAAVLGAVLVLAGVGSLVWWRRRA